MNFISILTDITSDFLQSLIQPFWVEVITDKPQCTYYFGSFLNRTEAEAACPGYIEDLESEGSKVIKATVKRCQPKALTMCNED